MTKDKSEKKKKRISEVAPAPVDGDVEMVEKESPKKEERDEIIIPLEDLSPIAHPLAQKKLLKKLQKTIKRASKARQIKRGVKEVAKAIRKGEKGLLVLAADITPIDIISHLPVLSEEHRSPGSCELYQRPTSCVMICPDSKRAGKSKEGDEEKKDYRELYDECCKEVSKLDQRVLF
ncbi:50S ribosomal protein L30e-like protein [Lactarius quietus]|nr:50S ribosomal protein L30e-like protein [Lactarius quietus]